MSHPYHHALSSSKKWGGVPDDYIEIHSWFDRSKIGFGDFRHRAMFHHAEGVFWCEQVFGQTLTNSDGRIVPVRVIGEQHVMEDLGRIPTMSDWCSEIVPRPWMNKTARVREVTVEI